MHSWPPVKLKAFTTDERYPGWASPFPRIAFSKIDAGAETFTGQCFERLSTQCLCSSGLSSRPANLPETARQSRALRRRSGQFTQMTLTAGSLDERGTSDGRSSTRRFITAAGPTPPGWPDQDFRERRGSTRSALSDRQPTAWARHRIRGPSTTPRRHSRYARGSWSH